MFLVNQSLQCNNTGKAAVNFKILLLIAKKHFTEGISFVDSTTDRDYVFGYEKNMYKKNIIALKYDSENDTVKWDMVYKEIGYDLEQYLKRKNVVEAEFKDVYTYLFDIKEKYLSDEQINKEVDSLIVIYPDKKYFFDFFRK